jgi:hypothetical protein
MGLLGRFVGVGLILIAIEFISYAFTWNEVIMGMIGLFIALVGIAKVKGY